MTAPEHPEFPLVMRAYDRPHVDDFLAARPTSTGSAGDRKAGAVGLSTAQGAQASELAAARHEAEDLQTRLRDAEARAAEPPPTSAGAVGGRVASIVRAATEAAEAIRAELETELHDLTRRRDVVREDLARARPRRHPPAAAGGRARAPAARRRPRARAHADRRREGPPGRLARRRTAGRW